MITETLNNLLHQTAFFNLDWGNYVMIAVACFFLYLAIKHEFEPLLLVPIAFGMLLVNSGSGWQGRCWRSGTSPSLWCSPQG